MGLKESILGLFGKSDETDETAKKSEGSDPMRELAKELLGSEFAKETAKDLLESELARETAKDLLKSKAVRETAKDLLESELVRDVAKDMAKDTARSLLSRASASLRASMRTLAEPVTTKLEQHQRRVEADRRERRRREAQEQLESEIDDEIARLKRKLGK